MAIPISNVSRRVVYAASGTGPYAFTFEILAATDIAVYKDDTLLTLTTDYSVTINTNGTGSVTLVASPTGATQIAIVGNRTIQRSTDFTTGGDFFANTLNDELDQQTIFAQQNAEGLARALQAPITDPASIDMTLPRKADRAGKFLAFDVDGNPAPGEVPEELASVNAIADEITTVAGIAADITTVAGIDSDVTTVSGISADVTTVAGISADITAAVSIDSADLAAVAAIAADVTAVAAIDSDVSAVSAIAADVTTVAADGTDIGTVAGISANVTTVAGISGNVTTVAGISANVTSVAGNATNINTVAGISANVTTVAGISADVTAVAGDATDIGTVATDLAGSNTIGTVAGIAANVTTVAGISADVTAVAGVDSADLAAVAGVAADVATVSGISADVSAVAAIDSDVTTVATNVADITNFADVYQGPKSSDPSTRNDSSALQAGDLYFNTVDDAMKVYTGSAWVAAYVSGSGYLAAANNLSDLTSASTARTNLGLATVAATGAYSDLSGTPTNVSDFANDSGYLTDITGESLADLSDVYSSIAPTDGQLLTWDNANSRWDAADAPVSLPSQTGNDGKFLTTDGTDASWAEIATGNTTANGLWENSNEISSNYTITTNYNAMSAGPITVASGVTVTVPTGSRWVVI